jgi:hypothetical protein
MRRDIVHPGAGNLTYEIPDGVDLGQVQSVSVWCRRFSVGFGVAPLVAPA